MSSTHNSMMLLLIILKCFLFDLSLLRFLHFFFILSLVLIPETGAAAIYKKEENFKLRVVLFGI